jgi:hypothetical protein
MANREACELYIEQEIKAGLEKGKKPYSIGQDLSAWIEKLFEVNIKPRTIEQRVRRIEIENATNVANDSTHLNDSEKEEIKEIKRAKDGTLRGGTREGAGRPKKKRPQSQPINHQTESNNPYTDADLFARTAILHLERIDDDDPNALEALDKVSNWIAKRKSDLTGFEVYERLQPF